MKTKMLIYGLCLSLLFNLSVLVGMMSGQKPETSDAASENLASEDPKVDEAELKRVREELHLNDDQVNTFTDLRKKHFTQNSVFDESLAVIKQSMASELRKDAPDVERLRSLVEQENELHRQRRMARTELFGRFLDTLSPQQRRELGGRLFPPPRHKAGGRPGPQGQPGPPPPPPLKLRRFDTDRNGVLDQEELRKAQEALDARRREVLGNMQGPRR